MQETVECTFILKHVSGIIKTYSHTQNSLVFVFELSGCGFLSHCRHLNNIQFLYYNLIEVIILLYTVLVTFLLDAKIVLINGFRLISFEIHFPLQSERK